MSELSGADVVVRFLESLGRDHVFGLAGSSTASIFHTLGDSPLEMVRSLDEGSAVAMADAYARLAGPTGAVLYMLPGTAVGLGNLYNAWRDETPLVVLCGQQASAFREDQGTVGEGELVDLVKPFTRRAWEVRAPEGLAHHLAASLASAVGPPPGPTFVSIPLDVLEGPAVAARISSVGPWSRRPPQPSDVGEVVERFQQAERPVVVVGGQLHRCGGTAALERLVGELEVPVAYEPFWNDRLGIAPGHRCAVGPLTHGSGLTTGSDFVLGLGCRVFNEVHPTSKPWFGDDAYLAHVNLDPAKLSPSADWSCAADPAAFVTELQRSVEGTGLGDRIRGPRREWLDEAVGRRSRLLGGSYGEVARAIATAAEGGLVVDESVTMNYGLVAALDTSRADRYLSTTGGSLGWGAGAACGAALATGEHVACVQGDGAFFFGLQGLWPAVALDLPITFVVVDNRGFGSTRHYQRRFAASKGVAVEDLEYVGSDFPDSPSILEVAAGFAIPGAAATDAAELQKLLYARLEDPRGPYVLTLDLAGD